MAITLPTSVEKGPTKKTVKTDYPTLNSTKVDRAKELIDQIAPLEEELEKIKADLKDRALPKVVAHIHGDGQSPGVKFEGAEATATVIFKDGFRSGIPKDDAIALVGKKEFTTLFKQRVTLAVSGDTLIEKLGEDKAEEAVARITKLFVDLGVPEAFSIKEDFIPVGVKPLFESLSVEALQELGKKLTIPSSVNIK